MQKPKVNSRSDFFCLGGALFQAEVVGDREERLVNLGHNPPPSTQVIGSTRP